MARPSETIDDGSLGEGPEGAQLFRRGAELGRYVVLDRVGAGAMGIVVAAFDSQLDRKVALKFLLAHKESSEAQARFVREAQALAKLSHPNVVAVHDAGTIEGYVFIAMEFVAGQTLRRWLAEAERTPAQVIEVFVAAGRGLAAAHAAGIVHRDVKPDNFMIGPAGQVKVMDFGLARTHAVPLTPTDDDDPSPELTRRGALVGTPAYMSPEQHAGKPADARSDQFAFCVALFEALYGRRPFAGATLPELVRNVGTGETIAAPPDRDVPPSIHAVLTRGLSPDPAQRFASMDDLLEELARDRDRPRRRFIVGGVIALYAIVALLAYEVAEGRREAMCEAKSRELGEVWNADIEALDRYAAAWAEAAATVCRASRVETAFTLEERERAEHCLQRGKEMFAAVVEEAEDSNAVALLRPPEACADPTRLDDLPVPLLGPELRHRIDRAHVLHAVGRHEDALALLEAIDHDEPIVRAEVHALRGAIERDLGLDAQAETSYEAALFEATRAGHDALVVTAALGLAQLDPSQASRWIRHAEAVFERSGSTDPALAAAIDEAR